MREKEDLISIGAYVGGSDPQLDAALAHRSAIDAFLRQSVSESSDPTASDARILEIAASLRESIVQRSPEVLDGEVVTAVPSLAQVPEPGPSAIPLLGATL